MRNLWLALLTEIYNRVNQAKTLEEKLSIITKQINITKVYELSRGLLDQDKAKDINQIAKQLIDNTKLYEFTQGDTRIYYGSREQLFKSTHGYALAICTLNSLICSSFVNIILANGIKLDDNKLAVWGYRQPFYSFHLVFAPSAHICELGFDGENIEDTIARAKEIIRILANNGADPNKIERVASIGIYENPPMAAGEPSGDYGNVGGQNFYQKYYRIINELRAEALLYRMDPSVIGSSFYLNQQGIKECIMRAYNLFNQYRIKGIQEEFNLAPIVKTLFKEKDQKLNMLLANLLNKYQELTQQPTTDKCLTAYGSLKLLEQLKIDADEAVAEQSSLEQERLTSDAKLKPRV